ncbi:MAG: hypothetical protein K6F69_11140 [Treponema sp.]|nr:hypothetical protein [Treponema sp.]
MRFRLSVVLCSLVGVLSILTGCNGISTDMDIDNAIYSWSLGCDNASFTVTSATVNGVEQLDSSVEYDDLSYSTNLSGYLTYNFDPAEDCTVVYTVTDYTAGEESYEQWVSFLTADSGQWSLRADFYSNEKISGLSNVNYYYNTYDDKNSNTYANVTLWNDKSFYITMTWYADFKTAVVQALDATNNIEYGAFATNGSKEWYYASASLENTYTENLKYTLASESTELTVTSATVNGVEQLSSNHTQSNLAYADYASKGLGYTFSPSSNAEIIYYITDYTSGGSAYTQWLAFLNTESGTLLWGLRPDNYSADTSGLTDSTVFYSGSNDVGTYTDPEMWNDKDFRVIMKYSATTNRVNVFALEN